jgi:predicted PhzF superfamily epimerase YddE/YHI9
MPTTGFPVVQVNAFTSEAFGGNPAAVCLLPREVPDRWLQQVAREMNLSETAFVRVTPAGLSLRWFTPLVEVDLCGHATLATAHACWSEGWFPADQPLEFQTRSGRLGCRRSGDRVELDFPATPAHPIEVPPGLFEALGGAGDWVGQSLFDYAVHYPDPAVLRGLQPDFRRLGQFPVRGVVVTSPSDLPGVDFLSRFFAPAVGVDEDPVCGSAHCVLAPFWRARLGSEALVARQVSARQGELFLECRGERVQLAGRAVSIWRGQLLAVPAPV